MKKNLNPKIESILDYVIVVSGNFPYQEQQFFKVKNKNNSQAFLIQATDSQAFLLSNNNQASFEIGDELVVQEDFDKVKTSLDYFGKVIDIHGNILFPENAKFNHEFLIHESNPFNNPVGMMEREVLDSQLFTGILSIDLFNPIGKGQRELIIGDRQTGKTHIALNTIINQKNHNVKCIYVSIGQKKQDLTFVYKTLEENGALDNTIILSASASNPFDQYIIPYIAMAHAENLSYDHDVLIVFDDLSKHASVYREVALLIGKSVGKEAFPSDIFFAHSKLLEKSGKFIKRKTITALPIVKTIDNDITSLIASNIISITDGQIVTDAQLFASGKIPAINMNLSISRTGTSVQSKNIAKTSVEISKIYHAYSKQKKLSELDYELNKETSNLLYKGKEIEKFLIQKGIAFYSEELMLIGSKIINWGLLQNLDNSSDVVKFINVLIKYDSRAIKIFNDLKNDVILDEFLIKNYFSFAINQFLEFQNSKNRINCEIEFIKFNKEEIQFLISKMMEVNDEGKN